MTSWLDSLGMRLVVTQKRRARTAAAGTPTMAGALVTYSGGLAKSSCTLVLSSGTAVLLVAAAAVAVGVTMLQLPSIMGAEEMLGARGPMLTMSLSPSITAGKQMIAVPTFLIHP